MIDYNELLETLDSKQYLLFQSKLLSENEVDIAAFLEEIPKEKAILIFRLLPKDVAAEVFAELFWETQQTIVESLSDIEIGAIINDLYIDDAVDFIEEMPAGMVKRVLRNANPETRAQINQLLKYPENSAGTIMTVEFMDLKGNQTVSEALERIRNLATESVTINPCYVTDSTRHLEGIVSIKRLLLSLPESKISDIMTEEYVYVNTTDDQEAVAHMFDKYDVVALPVVDSERRLVGIITVDDVLDVVQEEATEDFEKMAAMRPSEKPYLRTGIIEMARNRVVWLIILMFSGMITGGIIGSFDNAIVAVPLLVTFIPMLMDTGGNAGNQSSTMVIRGIALQEIKTSDVLKVWRKEVGVSLFVGVILSGINYIGVLIRYPGQEPIALTIAISLLLTVVIAKSLGALLPILAKTLKADPALMASPIITTIVDACSLTIFFLFAQRLLGI